MMGHGDSRFDRNNIITGANDSLLLLDSIPFSLRSLTSQKMSV
eukprot:SAG31_NODE_210_length_20286_cov_22.684748_13_plen_43_part_00